MAEVSHPHTDQPWPETRWRQVARKFFDTGVLAGYDNELAVSDGGALDVAVDTGRAFVDGFEYVNTTSTTVTLDAADPSNDRIDLVVLEYDPDGAAAGQGTVRLDKVTGTPAASPSAPSPTQNEGGVFQYVLAEVTVPAGSASLGSIDDRRDLIDLQEGVVQTVTATSSADDTTQSTSLQSSSLSASITPKYDDSVLRVRVDGTVKAEHDQVSAGSTRRQAEVAIRNTTDGVTLVQNIRGRQLVSSSQAVAASTVPIALKGEYTVDSRDTRTFELQFLAETGALIATIVGSETGGVSMTIDEVRP